MAGIVSRVIDSLARLFRGLKHFVRPVVPGEASRLRALRLDAESGSASDAAKTVDGTPPRVEVLAHSPDGEVMAQLLPGPVSDAPQRPAPVQWEPEPRKQPMLRTPPVAPATAAGPQVAARDFRRFSAAAKRPAPAGASASSEPSRFELPPVATGSGGVAATARSFRHFAAAAKRASPADTSASSEPSRFELPSVAGGSTSVAAMVRSFRQYTAVAARPAAAVDDSAAGEPTRFQLPPVAAGSASTAAAARPFRRYSRGPVVSVLPSAPQVEPPSQVLPTPGGQEQSAGLPAAATAALAASLRSFARFDGGAEPAPLLPARRTPRPSAATAPRPSLPSTPPLPPVTPPVAPPARERPRVAAVGPSVAVAREPAKRSFRRFATTRAGPRDVEPGSGATPALLGTPLGAAMTMPRPPAVRSFRHYAAATGRAERGKQTSRTDDRAPLEALHQTPIEPRSSAASSGPGAGPDSTVRTRGVPPGLTALNEVTGSSEVANEEPGTDAPAEGDAPTSDGSPDGGNYSSAADIADQAVDASPAVVESPPPSAEEVESAESLVAAAHGAMTPAYLHNLVEAALLAAGRPLSVNDLLALFDEPNAPGSADIRTALEAVRARWQGRGLELVEVSSGFRLQVRREYSAPLSRLWVERPPRYSRALLETLALVAYRQPVSRGEIEEVRGVSVSANIIRTLQEREWIRVVGHRDVPGRPELFGTTRQFLDDLGLTSLESLPPLSDIKDIESINSDLFSDPGLPPLPVDGDSDDPPAESALEGVGSDTANEADSDGADADEPADAPPSAELEPGGDLDSDDPQDADDSGEDRGNTS